MKRFLFVLVFAFVFNSTASAQVEVPSWKYQNQLPDARNGRYDDIKFPTLVEGWAVTTVGEIWHTPDAGASWVKQVDRAGTAFRSIAFQEVLSSRGKLVGWAGAIFSPTSVLWETRDSGEHWVDITHRIEGVIPKGICGLFSLNHSAWGVGAFNGDPTLIRTNNGGITWIGSDLGHLAGALIDVYFQDEMTGFAVGGSGDALDGDAVVLRTENGGKTWSKVFQSTRQAGIQGEWGWKISFPTKMVGYVSVEYRANPNSNDAKVLKTTDGGLTWKEIAVKGSKTNLGLQGIGFVTPNLGWASGRGVTSVTNDGGETWQQLPPYSTTTEEGQLDGSMNRFIIVNDTLSYGVGRRLYRLSGHGSSTVTTESYEVPHEFDLESSYPNPFTDSTTLRFRLQQSAVVRLSVIDMAGRIHRTFDASTRDPGTHEIVWNGRNDAGQKLPPGSYIMLIDIGTSMEMKQVVLLR